MSYKSLAKDLDISEEQAKIIHSGYFGLYAGVRSLHEWVSRHLRSHGYFSMVAGGRYRRFFAQRKQILAGILKEWQIRDVEREAVNNIPQGSAIDTAKLGMLSYYKTKRVTPDLRSSVMVIQVHDEVVAYAREENSKQVAQIMRDRLEKAFVMDVPIVANVNIVKRWADAK